jgi:hypothetical protein
MDLREALQDRDEWESAEWIQLIYQSVEWPLAQLKSLYAIDDQEFSNDEYPLAEVCLFYVEKQMRELVALVQEMDDSYVNAH